ncbi:MAG: hypothetical protein IPM34_00990 [Saprospiraceae bacterium]|nr:hypothetical protein [Saprospiraceae bacterium]
MGKVHFTRLFLVMILCAVYNRNTGSTQIFQESDGEQICKKQTVEFCLNREKSTGEIPDLMPLDIINRDSKNVFEKYGIEFSGYCYACDLAKIRVEDKQIQFINVCDAGDFFTLDRVDRVEHSMGFKVISKDYEFTFTKIDKTPVYKLEIAGKEFSLENKRILKYFAEVESLKKFKVHDCGEFGG